MAARATWKGYLKISLVNIPVRVFPATDAAATISFNQLHRECRSRIQQKKWCPTCQTDVATTDLVKGYEFDKGKYVVMEEDDMAKVKTESTRVINVVQFADAAVIDLPGIGHNAVGQQPDLVPRLVIPFLESLPFGESWPKP